MRTGTLKLFSEVLMADNNNNWFMGFVNDTSNANLPMLNAAELKEIACRINPKIKHEVNIEQVRQLQHPLYLQYYYKSLLKDGFTLTQVDKTTVFDQVLHFVKTKVGCDNETSERQMLLNIICERMIFDEQKFYATKADIEDDLKHYKAGYHELLTSGYLVETSTWAGINAEVRVEFANEDFLCYAIALQLLKKSNYLVSDKLFSNIHNLLLACPWRVKIAKWFIMHAIKTEQFITASMLNALQLSLAEKAEMLAFWGDLFAKNGSNNDYMQHLFELPGQEDLIGYFVGKEFSEAGYHSTLAALLNFKLSERSLVIVHMALAMNAVLTLDLNEVEKQSAILSNLIEYGEVDLPFDPVICFNTLYQYLKFGIVKTDAFVMLTKVCFNGPRGLMDHPSYQQFYLLGIYTLRLSGNYQKVLRLIDNFDRSYGDKKADYPAYDFFAGIARVDALLAVDEAKALMLYEEISKTHHRLYNEYAALMKMHFAMLKLKVMVVQKDVLNIQWQMQVALNHADLHGFKLLKARCLALMLQNSTDLQLNESLHKHIYYDLIKLKRECALNNDWFVEGAA